MSAKDKQDKNLPKVRIAYIGEDGVTQKYMEIDLDLPTILRNQADAQKLADNSEAVLLTARSFLNDCIQKQLVKALIGSKKQQKARKPKKNKSSSTNDQSPE